MKDAHSLSPNLEPIPLDCNNILNFGKGAFNYSQLRDKVGFVIDTIARNTDIPVKSGKFIAGVTIESDSNQPFPETSRYIQVNKDGDACAISYGYNSNGNFYDVRSIIRIGSIISGKIVEYRLTNVLRPLIDTDENRVEVNFMREFLVDFEPTTEEAAAKRLSIKSDNVNKTEFLQCAEALREVSELIANAVMKGITDYLEDETPDIEKNLNLIQNNASLPRFSVENKQYDDYTEDFDIEPSLLKSSLISEMAHELIYYGYEPFSITKQTVLEVGLKKTIERCTYDENLDDYVKFFPEDLTYEQLSEKSKLELGLAQFIRVFCKEHLTTGFVVIHASEDSVKMRLKMSQRNFKQLTKVSELNHYLCDGCLIPF